MLIKTNILIFLLVILSSLELQACINDYYYVDKQGKLTEGDDYPMEFNTNFGKEILSRKFPSLETKIKEDGSYKNLSDYAVLLLKTGKTQEALDLLVVLYAAHPKEYKLAANLGTAYELNGQVDSALVYIKRGLEIYPDAHANSEWVHVKVLEAKLLLAENPNYLQEHTVLQLTEKQEKDIDIRDQIETQVRERFPFSPGPNPIMASLLIDLADCTANTYSVEIAIELYYIAKKYYGATGQELMTKIAAMKEVKERNKEIGKPGLDKIRYRGGNLLRNNDKQNFQVDWKNINTDVDDLLSMVGLKRPKKDVVEKVDDTIEMVDTTPAEKENSIQWILVLLAVLFGGIGLFLMPKRRK